MCGQSAFIGFDREDSRLHLFILPNKNIQIENPPSLIGGVKPHLSPYRGEGVLRCSSDVSCSHPPTTHSTITERGGQNPDLEILALIKVH